MSDRAAARPSPSVLPVMKMRAITFLLAMAEPASPHGSRLPGLAGSAQHIGTDVPTHRRFAVDAGRHHPRSSGGTGPGQPWRPPGTQTAGVLQAGSARILR